MINFKSILLTVTVFFSLTRLVSADSSYLSAGGYHFAGVNGGQVIGFGDETYGQFGTSGSGTDISGMSPAKQVAAGGYSTIALKLDGTVWFLGEKTIQHTTPHGTPNAVTTAAQVSGLSGIDVIAAGHRHYLALDKDTGDLYAWGHNGSGQVGNGSLLDVQTPVQVLTGVASMSAGDSFSAAVKTNGTVYTWGKNAHGQLGIGDTADRLNPTRVAGISTASAVSAGGQHCLILLSDGTLLAAGDNSFGQLGNGTTASASIPVAVSGLSGIADISAGYHHSAAIGPANQVYLWGRNYEGQCAGGIHSAVSYTLPQTVLLSGTVQAISCGYHFTIFRLNDGKIWGTGSNSDGQLDGVSLADQDSSQKVLTPMEMPLVLDFTLPTVDAGSNVITWSGRYVQLAPTVINNSDPQTDLIFHWTAASDDGVVFAPDEFEQFAQVTITKQTANPSTVTLTLAVNNEYSGKPDVTDNLVISVYDTVCKATIAAGLKMDNDLDNDCEIGLADIAELANKWLKKTSLEAPQAIP